MCVLYVVFSAGVLTVIYMAVSANLCHVLTGFLFTDRLYLLHVVNFPQIVRLDVFMYVWYVCVTQRPQHLGSYKASKNTYMHMYSSHVMYTVINLSCKRDMLLHHRLRVVVIFLDQIYTMYRAHLVTPVVRV